MVTRESQHDGDGEWRDWASLHQDMVAHIANLLLDDDGLSGYIQLRAACKPWKDAMPNPAALGPREIGHRFHPRRWMMISSPPPPASGATLRRRFLNIDTRKIVEVDLPQLASHDVVVGSARAPEGLLVLLDRSTFVVRLLNPLTGHVVDLPSLNTLYPPEPSWSEGHIFDKFWSDNMMITAAGFADRSTVVVYLGWMNKMAVAKPGDTCWTLVGLGLHSRIRSTFTFQGHFYCIENNTLKTLVVSMAEAPPRLEVAAAAELDKGLRNINMVDNDGKLMLVCSTSHPRYGRNASRLLIILYEMNLEESTVRQVCDLGGGAVFAGELGTVLVPSTRYYPLVDSDAVYFRFGVRERYLGIQRVHDGRNGSSFLCMSHLGHVPTLVTQILLCVNCVGRDGL